MKIQHMILAVCVSIVLAFIGGSAYSNVQNDAALAVRVQAETGLRESLLAKAAALAARAEACEVKFSVGTVLYEYRAPLSMPLLHGTLSLSLGSEQNPAGNSVPTWIVPAQIEPITNIPGAMYTWIDLKTGEAKGTFTSLNGKWFSASQLGPK